jgi:hypothetical protein
MFSICGTAHNSDMSRQMLSLMVFLQKRKVLPLPPGHTRSLQHTFTYRCHSPTQKLLVTVLLPRFDSCDRQLPTQKLDAYKSPCSCDKMWATSAKRTVTFPPGFRNTLDTRLENQRSTVAEHSTGTKHSIDLDRSHSQHPYLPSPHHQGSKWNN